MNISEIANNNYKVLEKFINQKHPSQFRYYDSRGIEVVKNHKLTIVGTIDGNPIAYGHIDIENGINWIGLCVLEGQQGKGYGKKIFSYLLDFINLNNISNIKLSVDIDNYRALNLYLKHNFTISSITDKHYVMKYNSSIELPVSMGEALDKLTILEIKMKKITDARRVDVEKEFNLLSSKLEKYKKEYIFYYNILLTINESIWDMQDQFRDSNNPQEQNRICIQIIKENDNRFRVKKKINNLNNSILKEQKGYKPKTAFVISHLGLGDMIISIGMVRYLSTCYDEVIVVCKQKNSNNVQKFYQDDATIKLYIINVDKDISPNYGFNLEEFKKITKNMDIYLCGYHNPNRNLKITDIPFDFYKHVNINPTFFWEYFYITPSEESIKLYEKINNIDYVFLHNLSSTGEVFSVEEVEKKFKINKNNILIINPNKNIYDINHKFYDYAEQFVWLPLKYYIDTIINANKIFLTDSSFFCLSINLPIKTTECYYMSRSFDYTNLFSNKQLLNKLKKPIFKSFD